MEIPTSNWAAVAQCGTDPFSESHAHAISSIGQRTGEDLQIIPKNSTPAACLTK
jgi:hypothetical protein